MLELLVFVPFLLVVVAANVAERHRLQPYTPADPGTRRLLDRGLPLLPYVLLAALNLALLAGTVVALLNAVAQQMMPELLDEQSRSLNWLAMALATALTGLLGFVPLLAGVRRWLARFLPLDPASPVHMAALVLAVHEVGLSLAQMALVGSLENLADMSLALTAWDVLLSGLPLLLFGLLGVGWLVRRGGRATLQRLGVVRPTARQLLAALLIAFLLLGLDLLVNLVWAAADPFGYELMDEVMRQLFGGLGGVLGALVLGLSAGISEEVLFRGAVQPRLGIVLAALLFTIGHLQYSLTPATLEVFVIGLILGLVRRRTNTTVCIAIHALYNAIGTLLGAW